MRSPHFRPVMFLALCCATAALGTVWGAQAAQLAGLGLHQETGRDIYLGALFLPDETIRPSDLRQLAGPRTMEYRVVARRTSIRSLLGSILLQSEIATGKPPSASTAEFADALLSQVRGSLYSGDGLQIALTADNQTVARLNGYTLAQVDDPEVANYFLIGWIQERGPTTAFRDAMMSPVIDTALRERLETSKPNAQRLAEVALWAPPGNAGNAGNAGNDSADDELRIDAQAAVAPDTTSADAPTAAQEIPSAEALPDSTAEALATADTASQPAMNDTTSSAIAIAVDESNLDGQVEAIDGVPGEAAELPELVLGNTLDAPADAPSLDALGNLQDPSISLALSSSDLGGIELDSEVLALGVREYSRRLSAFHNGLVARVYRAIKYPKRAIRRNLEGRLELDITLRESGELVAVSVAETSGHSLLDDAAVEAAEQALAAAGLSNLDVVAVAEFGNRDGRVVVPVPVNFQLMQK